MAMNIIKRIPILDGINGGSAGCVAEIKPEIGDRELRNPVHSEILDRCKELHEAKSHDYSQDDNVFSNFEYAAKVSEIFTDPVDRVFATMIAIKMARLAELLKGKTPKHESIEDTVVDMVNYNAIWGSYTIRNGRQQQVCERPVK